MKKRLQTEFRVACVCAGFAALVSGAQAKTLAWYRFDEAAPGEKPTAGEATILNAVDSTLFPATAWTEAKGGSLSTDATYLATYADAFPAGAKVFDPLSGMLSDNGRCLQFKADGNQWGDFYGTFLTVADDERLHVPSVTVELFARFDGAADLPLWRNLVIYPNDSGNVWALRVGADGIPLFQFAYLKDGVATDKTLYGDVSIKDGKWHHLAFVVRSNEAATAYQVSLYQDYRHVRGEWVGPLAYGTSGKALSIGHAAGASYGAWPGLIDEVRISDEPLAPEQFLRPNTGWANCHPETVVYVPFGGMPFFGSDALASSVHLNQAVPTGFATISNVKLTGTDHAALSSDICAPDYRRDVMSTETVPNETVLSTTVRTDDRDLCPYLSIYDVADGYHTALADSWTFEIFGNFETPSGRKGLSYLFHCSSLTIPVTAGDGKVTLLVNWDWNNSYSAPICDGQWHHIAVSYDRPRQTMSLYVDYRLIGLKTGVDFNAQGNDGDYLQVLNGYGDGQQGVHGLSDGFRLTARALTPQEFLTGHAVVAADYAAWIDFEDDMGVKPYADVTPEGVFVETEDGVQPSLSVQRPGKWLEAADGTQGRENRQGLALSGGSAVWGRNLMIENLENQTVEFFLRGTASEEGASLVRLADGSGETVWAVEATADGTARVRVGASVHAFETAHLTDNAWHHWAVTFAIGADEASTAVTLWRDGAAVGSFTVGTLTRTFASSSLVVGGGAAFAGFIDEIRISPRVLDAEEMLRHYRMGIVIRVR